MSKGLDRVLSEGNLTMGQVGSMFQRLVKEHNTAANFDVTRLYGMPIYYSEETTASNPLLNSAIQDFVRGYEIASNGSQLPIGNNFSLLLVRANSTLNTGTAREMAQDSNLSTHWTVLNLRKNNGEIEVRYADSIGSHNGTDKIPQTIKKSLLQHGINAGEQQRSFTSSPQTQANCGYLAVWHALKMHYIPTLENPKKFVEEEKKNLIAEAKQNAETSNINSVSHSHQVKHDGHTQDDDSSDDEVVTNAVYGEPDEETGIRDGGYDLQDQWQEFCLGDPNNASESFEGLNEEEQNAWRPSFLMHAFGIGLLYSQQVNEKYYGTEENIGLKQKYLSDVRKRGEARSLVERNLNKIASSIFDTFFNYEWENRTKEKQKIVERVQKSLSKENYESLQDYIDFAAEKMSEVVIDFVVEGIDFPDSNHAIKNMPKALKAFFKRKLLNVMVDDLEGKGIISENKTPSSATKNPHKIDSAKWSDSSKGMVVTLQEKGLHNVAEFLTNKKGGKTLFEELIDDEVLAAYFDDLSSFQVDEYPETNGDLFRDFIQGLFNNTLLSRKTLPHRFSTDAIEDTVDFLAQIRLSNRSKFREVKNIKDSLGREDFFGKDAFARIKRYWRFNDGVVAEEEQLISSTSIARDSQVVILDNRSEGSYASLSSTIQNEIIGNFNQKYPEHKISSKVIAKWIRNKLNNEPLSKLEENSDIERIDVDRINQFITEFSYLLFGCEVARNPASLVSHQMMLDLIIGGKMEWEDCLTGDLLMPMAMKDAVQASRASHSKFADYMPWAYRYDGNESVEKMNVLVAAEKRLFGRWLALNKISPEFAEEALLIACKNWYGIEMDGVIYGVDNGEERSAAQVVLKKWTEKTIEDPSEELGSEDYILLTKILERSDFKPNEEEFGQIGKAVKARLEHLKSQNSPPEYNEKIFLKNLAQRKLFDSKSLDSKTAMAVKSSNIRQYTNMLTWVVESTLGQEDIWQEFKEAAVMVAWKEWFNLNRSSYSTNNPSESAIQNWLSEIEEDEELNKCGIGEENYELLAKALEIRSFDPSARMAKKISQTLYSRLTEAHQENETIDKKEELFYKTLAKQNMLNFEHVGDDYDNLISWVISMNLDSVAEEMIPKISTQFLTEELSEGNTTLMSIAADNNNEKICKLLIQKGVPVDELTKKSKFYKANEDIFSFKMPAMQSEIDEISRHISEAPSKVSTPLSHSKLSSRSSSRSGSISD